MGDAADDVWDAMFEHDTDIQFAIRTMKDRCPHKPCRCDTEWNDDGLLECLTCGQMIDL